MVNNIMKKTENHLIQLLCALTFGALHCGCSGEMDNKTNSGTLTELQAAEQELRQEHSIPSDPNERGRAFTAEERKNWPNACEILEIDSTESKHPVLIIRVSNARNFSLNYRVRFGFYINGANYQKEVSGEIEGASIGTIETELPIIPLLPSGYPEGESPASDEVRVDCKFAPKDPEVYLQYEDSLVSMHASNRFVDFDRSGLNRILPMSDASEVVIKITPLESLHTKP